MSSSGTSNTSSRRPSPRPSITGDIGRVAGASVRAIDRGRAHASRAACRSDRAARCAAACSDAAGHAPRDAEQRGGGCARSSGASTSSIRASRARARRARRRRSVPAASGTRSTKWASSSMPPTPSVTEWCTFIANAARSPSGPSSPSKSVNSQSGRARSKLDVAIGCSASSSARIVPGPGEPRRGAGGSRGRRSAPPSSAAVRSGTAATRPVGGAAG